MTKFNVGDKILVNNKMQKNYSYELVEPMGKNFAPNFNPELTPKQMLSMGVFEGKYLNDCKDEYPLDWFDNAKPSNIPNPEVNFMKVKSRLSLQDWRANGWIINPDPRGWFEWYCRYYLGRRIPEVDNRQIARWNSFKRHLGQVRKNCKQGDLSCRPVQRQALLQWAYDPKA